MNVFVDGRKFEFVVGSDIKDDGMYLEVRDEKESVVLFAFYYDQTGRFTFSSWGNGEEIPFELVEKFVQTAREQLPPLNTQDDATS